MFLKGFLGDRAIFFNQNSGQGGSGSGQQPPAATSPAPATPPPAPPAAHHTDDDDDPPASRRELERENFQLREQRRRLREQVQGLTTQVQQLQGQVPAQGAVVLKPEEAALWQTYQQLGAPDQVRQQLGELQTLRRNAQVASVAEVVGWNAPALQALDQLAGGLTYEIREAQVDGQTVRQAYVKVKDGSGAEQVTPLADFTQQRFAALIPALTAQGGQQQQDGQQQQQQQAPQGGAFGGQQGGQQPLLGGQQGGGQQQGQGARFVSQSPGAGGGGGGDMAERFLREQATKRATETNPLTAKK
jgi:hypothetical protein